MRSFSPIATRRSRSTLRALGGRAGTGAAGVAAAADAVPRAPSPAAGAPAGRRITSTSSPRLGASERVKSTRPSSTPKRPSSASVVASSRSAALPLVTMRRSTRPSSSKRSAVSLSRAAGAASKLASPSSETLPLPPLGGERLDARAAAAAGRSRRCRRLTFTPCRKLRTPRLRAFDAAGVFRRAEAPADRRAGVQLAGQAPARRHPACPRCRGWRRAASSTPSIGVRGVGPGGGCGVVRAMTAPEATPSVSPASAGGEAPDAVVARRCRGAGR